LLRFDNAAIRLRVASADATYSCQWSAFDNMNGVERSASGNICSSDTSIAIPETAWGPRDSSGFRYAIARIKTFHQEFPGWAAPVTVTVRERDDLMDVVGIERPSDYAAGNIEEPRHVD
jgi:hypothetical protein